MFSRTVVSDSLRPQGLQHARLPRPSLSPQIGLNLNPLSRWHSRVTLLPRTPPAPAALCRVTGPSHLCFSLFFLYLPFCMLPLCVSPVSLGSSFCFLSLTLSRLLFWSLRLALWVVSLTLSLGLCHSSLTAPLPVFLCHTLFVFARVCLSGSLFFSLLARVRLSLFLYSIFCLVSPSCCVSASLSVWLSLSFWVAPPVSLSISASWSLPHRLPVTPTWLWLGLAPWC